MGDTSVLCNCHVSVFSTAATFPLPAGVCCFFFFGLHSPSLVASIHLQSSCVTRSLCHHCYSEFILFSLCFFPYSQQSTLFFSFSLLLFLLCFAPFALFLQTHCLSQLVFSPHMTTAVLCRDNSSNYGYMQWGYCNCWDASGTPPTLPPPTNPPTVAPTTVAPTTRAPTTAWPTYPPVAGAPPPTTPPPTPPPPERVPAPPPPSPGSSDKSTQRRSTGGNGAVVGILSILCASGLFAFLFVSHKNGNLKKWVDQANEYANENW